MQEGASFKPGAFLISQLLGIVAQSHGQSGDFVVLEKSISDSWRVNHVVGGYEMITCSLLRTGQRHFGATDDYFG